MAVGKPLHLRLFLEGIEIPVVSAQVSINVNAPATAAIQIVPIDQGMEFHPRTMVHLFFLDHFSVSPPTGDFKDRKDASAGNPDFLKEYKLLFSGEVAGFSFVQTPQSRGLILQCLDFSSYWDAAHATAIEYGPHGNLFSNQASLWGSDASHFDDIVNQQAEKLVQWIKSKPRTKGLETVSGLAGGIIHMLEAIGGVPSHSKGINDFFTVAELRCRLLQQITAEENDKTASNLLSTKVFDQWLRNGLQNIGQQVTFRDMMKLLFQYIYYEVVPNPAAKFDPDVSAATSKNSKAGSAPLNTHPVVLVVRGRLEKIVEDLLGGFGGLGGLGSEEDIKKIAVRQNAIDIEKLMAMLKPISGTAPAINDMLKAFNGLDAFAKRPAGQPPSNYTIPAASELLNKAIEYLKNTDKTVKVSSTTTQKTPAKLARLRSQIIRPDCWFAAPPRCNVIFPEHYSQLAYDRTYIGEVTRSLVMTYNTLIGKDPQLPQLADHRILAPNIGTNAKSLTQKAGKESYRVLMDHELHTGIVPRTEWIPNTSAGAQYVGGKDKDKLQTSRLNWAQKIALFHFFKYRFGSRQANLSGRFNPYVVCGFPTAVITRPYIIPGVSQGDTAFKGKITEFVTEQSLKHDPPTQLIGMIGAVSHSIDQTGGTTSIAIHHVRKHSGIDDEFLNVLVTEKDKGTKRLVKVVLNVENIRQNIAAMQVLAQVTPQSSDAKKAKTVKFTPQKKQVKVKNTSIKNGKKVQGTTTQTVNYRVESSQTATFTDFVQLGRIDKLEKDTLVPSPPGKITTGSQGLYGKVVGIEVLDSSMVIIPELNNTQCFSTVVLYEEVEVPVTARVPVEEVLRPRFFSGKYSNSEVGKSIYQPFFGVGSIVDEIIEGVTLDTTSEVNEGKSVEPDKKFEDLLKDFKDEESAKARASVENAVNFIGYVYGAVKAQGKDVDSFVRQYSQRPIATLMDMLGSPDLEITLAGTSVSITKGSYGFHSGAIHEKLVEAGNLAGLVDSPTLQLKRIDGAGKSSPVHPKMDVRKAKRSRVLAYIEALKRGTGLLG